MALSPIYLEFFWHYPDFFVFVNVAQVMVCCCHSVFPQDLSLEDPVKQQFLVPRHFYLSFGQALPSK